MIKKLAFLYTLILISSLAIAQDPQDFILNGAVCYDINSKIINSDIRISVSLPQGYDPKSNIKYPVLYVLDAFYSFPIIHEMHKMMASEIEPVIIVGIGDGRMSGIDWFVSRYSLLTYTSDKYEDSFHVNVLLNGLPVKMQSGNGQKYYDAIKTEVIPFIESHYTTNEDRGLVGHSLSGLFTSEVLFKDNGYFSRYGINSAALFFGSDEPFKLEQKYFESKKQLSGKVFISAAALEGDKTFVKRSIKFANVLRSRNYKKLKIESVVFPKESHVSVIAAMLSRSLYALYGLPVNRSFPKGHRADQ